MVLAYAGRIANMLMFGLFFFFAILLFSIFPGLSCPAKLAGDIAQLSASCGRVSETENGQEQGELRTAVSKATLFQPGLGLAID